jgi:hypothetical protein
MTINIDHKLRNLIVINKYFRFVLQLYYELLCLEQWGVAWQERQMLRNMSI